ncbi:MAG: SDR family oxidoreductase [Chitinophagaceae bacterium]
MKKTILITGSSSGIGLACANKLASRQHNVYGCSRNPDQSGGSMVQAVKMDVTRDDSVAYAIYQIINAEKKIDVLINNAGNGIAGPAYSMPYEMARKQFEVNFFGVVRMCSAVIPHMLQQKKGLIINISSLGGLFGLPYQGLYSASKFAIEGYSESLRMELRKTGIRVVVINPGDFKTEFGHNREKISFALQHDELKKNYQDALTNIEKDETSAPGPEKIAKKICRIVESSNPSHRYLVGQSSQTIVPLLKRLLPGALFEKLMSQHYGIK